MCIYKDKDMGVVHRSKEKLKFQVEKRTEAQWDFGIEVVEKKSVKNVRIRVPS